jgi:SM-20-related protein
VVVGIDVHTIARELTSRGFVTMDGCVPAGLLARLDDSCSEIAAPDFVRSGTGRGRQRHRDGVVRGDVVSWLDHAREADHLYLTVMEDLRLALNEQLFLGLLDYQCHYAIYGAGTRYEKHLDTLAGRRNRLLSTVVYLNSEWAAADGGELILYRGGDADAVAVARILPRPGLMVLFLSEDFPHEVLTAHRSRHSIAGWFSGSPRA